MALAASLRLQSSSPLCSVYEIYLVIEELKDAYREKYGDASNGSEDGRFLVYGHWFVLYAVALLLSKAGKAPPRSSEIGTLVLDALNLVARSCANVKGAHYQMFRTSKTKERILAELVGAQLTLFDLLEGRTA